MLSCIRALAIAALLISVYADAAPKKKKRKKATQQRIEYVRENEEHKASELLHQAPAGEFELSPSLGYTRYKYSFKSSASVDSAEANVLGIGLGGEYGLNEMFSIGVDLDYTNGKISYEPGGSDSTFKGFDDPSFSLNGQTAAGPGLLKFGVDLDLAIEDDETDSSGDSNAASGGHTLTPRVGYEMYRNGVVFGGVFAIDLYKGDRTIKDDSSTPSSYKRTGGRVTMFSVFSEFVLQSARAGAMLTYASQQESKTEASGFTSSTSSGSNTFGLSGYGAFPISPDLMLLPALTIGNLDPGGESAVDKVTVISGILNLRITL